MPNEDILPLEIFQETTPLEDAIEEEPEYDPDDPLASTDGEPNVAPEDSPKNDSAR